MSSKSLTHQVGILAKGRVLAFMAIFFVPIINTRALSVEELGYYRQFWLIITTLTYVLILGFPRSLLYYFPRSETEHEKSVYVTQTVAYLFIGSIAAIVIYTLMGQILGAGLGATVRTFYWRLCFITACLLLSRHMEELFVANKQVTRQATYYVVTSLVRALVVIIVSWYTRSVNAIIWGLTAYFAANVCFSLIYTKVAFRPSLRKLSFSTIREQLSYALPLGMLGIAVLLLKQTDKFIINRFMGREAFAVYSVGAFTTPLIAIIANSVANVTFPILARYQKEERFADFLDLWRRSWLKTAVLFFPLFAFLMVTADQFINILFTTRYADAAPVFRVYVVLFLMATTDYAGVLATFKKQDYLLKVVIVAAVINVVLGIVSYHAFGRLGVPISTAFMYFLATSLAVRKAGQLLGQSFWQTVPWKGLVARMAAAVAPAAVLYVVYARHGDYGILKYALSGVVYFSVYFFLCWITRMLTLEDLKSLVGKK